METNFYFIPKFHIKLMNINEIHRAILGLKYLRFLKKTEYKDINFLENTQSYLLKKQLLNCFENIPYYKRIFRKNDIFRSDIVTDSFKVLRKLPILTKNDVRKNYEDLISKKRYLFYNKIRTSGSTGEPLSILVDLNQWSKEMGFVLRAYNVGNYRFMNKMIMFRSYSPSENEPKIKINQFKRMKYFSVFHLSHENLPFYINQMKSFGAKCISSYPSSLQNLADLTDEIDFLTSAFTGSEVLTKNARETIENKLNLNIYDWYGQVEQTISANDCEFHTGLHLNMEYGIMEVQSSSKEIIPASHEISGEMIGTSLHNQIFPLLRYKTGDIASNIVIDKCECGRSSPQIGAIDGRESEIIEVGKYKKPATHLYSIIRNYLWINQFQLKKESSSFILFYTGKQTSHQEYQSLKNEIEKFLGVEVEIIKIDYFENKGKKHKVIVN